VNGKGNILYVLQVLAWNLLRGMEESWKKHQAVLPIDGILCRTALFKKLIITNIWLILTLWWANNE